MLRVAGLASAGAIAHSLRASRRTKGDHAQQRHLKAGARIGSEVEVAAPDDRRLVEKLYILGRDLRGKTGQELRWVKLIALEVRHRLPQSDAGEKPGELIKKLGMIGGPLLEGARRAEQLARVGCGEELGQAHDMVAGNRAEHGARLSLVRSAAAEGNELIEKRERIAHASIRRLRNEAHRSRLEFHFLRLEDARAGARRSGSPAAA